MSELPSGWAWSTVGDVAQLTDGPFGSNLKTAHYVDDGPRVVRLQNIGEGVFRNERAHITEAHYRQLEKHAVQPDDVVIASLGEEAPRACLIPPWLGPAIVKADCIRARPLAGIDPRFLMWMLNSVPIRRQAALTIKGIGRPRLGLSGIRQLRVPLPPPAEQQRIVAVIEEHFSRLDVAAASLDDVRRKAGNCWRALLVRTVGDRPQRRLAELVDVLDSQRVPVNREERATRPGTVPYYGATGQVGWIDRPLFNEELVLLGEDGAPFLDRDKPKAYVIDGPSWVNNHAHVLRAQADFVNPTYLKHALNTVDYRPWVTGTTRLKLTQAAMREIPVPVPDLESQQRIFAELDRAEMALTGVASHATQARQRGSVLRQAVLTAAFRGELAAQDPNDPSASVLLERIAAERAATPKPPRKRRETTPV